MFSGIRFLAYDLKKLQFYVELGPTLKGPVAEGEYTLGAMGVMAYDWLDEKGQKLKTMLFSILRHHPSCAKVFLPFK